MLKNLICLACPQGCVLHADYDPRHGMRQVEGQRCPRGEQYARQEIENPLRILTTTVAADGLELQRVPVRTQVPMPKAKQYEALALIKRLRLTHPVCAGDIVLTDLLGLKIPVIATRTVGRQPPSG